MSNILIQAIAASVMFMGFGFVAGVMAESARQKRLKPSEPCWHELLGRDIGRCMNKVVIAEKCSGVRLVQPASYRVGDTFWKITVERDEERIGS